MPDERDDDQEEPKPPPRKAGEGVRIIGAEEAAALDARRAGRLPEDAPRFGDVPPPPQGPRPAHRFPLPESESPAPVGRPATPNLPHWTEPPTGEVPRIVTGDEGEEEDDLKAWSGFTRGARWRDQSSDWADTDFDPEDLGGDEARVGALDPRNSAPGDPFSFDEPEPEPEPVPEAAPRTTRIRTRPEEPPEPLPTGASDDRNMVVSIATGVAIAVLAGAVFSAGPAWTLALATIVIVGAAVEAYDVFRRAGYRPATLLGLVATGSMVIAAYNRGERALPLVLALLVVFTMLWYLGGVVRARPTINLGVTLLGFMWVGFLGSFAGLLLRYPRREGVAFLAAAVIATVANDVGALFAGRQWGRAPMAPTISPHKTWEGAAGGTIACLIVCLIVVRDFSPWSFGSALALAVVVSVVAPLGDLCESMVKRDLGIKDMGSLLPGHGGVLDRFDAMLFVLPAVYYLVELLDLATV